MGKKVVIALGGNALGNSLEEQKKLVVDTAKIIVDLVADDYEVIVTHGNGPQVGLIHNLMNQGDNVYPLSTSVAMSKAYIASDLSLALQNELTNRQIKDKNVLAIMTHVVVDKEDEAFKNPTKPIGTFYSEAEARTLKQECGYMMMEDAGRGYRRVVPSPKPQEVVEIDAIRQLAKQDIVIACGGGGIPVVHEEESLIPVAAVIDKDYTSALLAKEVGANYFIILTAVDKVAIYYGKPEETWLDSLSIDLAKQYIAEGHFASGSMLPKVKAALNFIGGQSSGCAIITSLEKAREALAGRTGTRILR